MNFTVVGGKGFIGSKIVEQLTSNGSNVWVPNKDDESLFSKALGTVIYCAGHGDCEKGCLKVLQANTILLSQLVEHGNFDRLIFLSSTRVYMDQDESSENSNLTISYKDSRRLFNLSKLVAEEILLKSKKDIAIVRPSNVYGVALNSPLFLPSIARNAINNGHVDMFVSPNYAKDYVSVEDVAQMTIKIANDLSTNGQIFNVAAGFNTSAKEIAEILTDQTNCKIHWHENTQDEIFPVTDISAIKNHFGYQPASVLGDLANMLSDFKRVLNK